MATRRVRWECPNGCPAVLGSTRPPKDATARFCLSCSAKASRLVERSAPALERQRAAKATVRQTKAQQQRERERLAREAALKVTVLDYGEAGVVTLDAGELLGRAWRSDTLKAARADHGLRWMTLPPTITIRRGQPDKGRAARMRDPVEAVERGRVRDTMSGHSKWGTGDIVLTIAPGLGREWLEAIVVHEAAHSALSDGIAHGGTWRSTYIRAMRELYGVVVWNTSQASWRLDEDITLALREMGRCDA